jgi:hypothetical protein
MRLFIRQLGPYSEMSAHEVRACSGGSPRRRLSLDEHSPNDAMQAAMQRSSNGHVPTTLHPERGHPSGAALPGPFDRRQRRSHPANGIDVRTCRARHERQRVCAPFESFFTAEGHRSDSLPQRGHLIRTRWRGRCVVHVPHSFDRRASARLGRAHRRRPHLPQTISRSRPALYFIGGSHSPWPTSFQYRRATACGGHSSSRASLAKTMTG